MKILIDTHLFLWMLSDPDKLNQKRCYELASPANEVYLSSMRIAELMIKASLGKIDGAKIVSIHSKTDAGQKSVGGLSGGATVNSSDIQSLQQSIMANEQIMAMIMNLQDDPEIQAILQDPEMMEAVNAGDMNALLGNPKFRQLMENSKIKAITKEAAKE